MPEIVGTLFFRPPFQMAQAPAAKRRLLMPTWVPDPCKIRSVQFWSQGDFPAGAVGDIALAVDPRSEYCKEANFPTQELTTPLIEKSLGAMTIKQGADRKQWDKFQGDDYVDYRASQGDCLIFTAESFGTDFQLAPSFEVFWEQDGDSVFPYPTSTKLMIEGTYFPAYGDKVIRDHSVANHQLQLRGGAHLNTAVLAPGRTSSIEFTGTGGIDIEDHLYDFDWPGDFEISANVRTVTTALDQTAFRHIFAGGTGATAAALVTTTGGLLGFGNEGNGLVATGTSNIADDQWHAVKANRTAGVVTLWVDGVQQASVADTTHYTATSTASIGRYNFQGGRGQWLGYMGDVRVIKPF